MDLNEVRRALARHPSLVVSTSGRIVVDVPLGARAHRIRVSSAWPWLRVEGKIVNMADLAQSPKAAALTERILSANTTAELYGLARDEDSWLVARYDLPPDADGTELVETILRVARVADRWELLWSGDDAQ